MIQKTRISSVSLLPLWTSNSLFFFFFFFFFCCSNVTIIHFRNEFITDRNRIKQARRRRKEKEEAPGFQKWKRPAHGLECKRVQEERVIPWWRTAVRKILETEDSAGIVLLPPSHRFSTSKIKEISDCLYLILQWALEVTVATTRLWIAISLPFPVAKLSASAIATLSLPVLPLSLASSNPWLLFYQPELLYSEPRLQFLRETCAPTRVGRLLNTERPPVILAVLRNRTPPFSKH